MVEVCSVYLASLARRFANDRHGSTAIEYGLIAALVSAAAIAAMTALGTGSSGLLQKAVDVWPM